jgi:hypothetical protein
VYLPLNKQDKASQKSSLALQMECPAVVEKSSQQPTKEDWDRIRPIFEQLYRRENKPLKAISALLKRGYAFSAT